MSRSASELLATATSDRHRPSDAHERKSLLRFITCGSVDDGKSTLIGRLLYESKRSSTTSSRRSRPTRSKFGTQRRRARLRAAASTASPPSASRASRSTSPTASSRPSARKFIVADTPGHEQYTRNMVTGASTADLAVILVDARKGVLTQTRRHSYLVVAARHPPRRAGGQQDGPRRLLARSVSEQIEREYRDVRRASSASTDDHLHPAVGAARRQRRAPRARACRGTTGPTLLEHLESVEPDRGRGCSARRSACRCSGSTGPNSDFRGFAGHDRRRHRAARATRSSSRPRAAQSHGGAHRHRPTATCRQAVAGQSVTLTLADEIDISRGDVHRRRRRAARGRRPVRGDDRLDGRGADAARPPLPDEDRHRARCGATLSPLKYKIDVNTLEHARGARR